MAQQPCYIRSGGMSIDHTPSSAVAGGDVVLQGTLLGIASQAIAAAAKGSLQVRCVADVPKDTSALTSVGTAIYWDEDGTPVGTAYVGAFTSTATGNTFAGWYLGPAEGQTAAGAGVATMRALILSSFAVSVTTIDALTDVGTVDYTAGDILIADGSKFECLPISGPLALTAAGLLNIKTATVAAAGSTQSDANAVTNGFTLVSAADATKGVKLPTAVAGDICIIKNNVNAVLKIWPNTSDAINALSANAALSIAALTSVVLVAYDATTWYSVPLLPS